MYGKNKNKTTITTTIKRSLVEQLHVAVLIEEEEERRIIVAAEQKQSETTKEKERDRLNLMNR